MVIFMKSSVKFEEKETKIIWIIKKNPKKKKKIKRRKKLKH